MKTPLLLVASAWLFADGTTVVQAQDTAQRLPPVVTVTRSPERSTLDLPLALSSIAPDSARPGQTHMQIEQMLMHLPGVTVSNRNNPTQDTRIVIRGFGARSQFGVRSIRVLRDGMPITLPDGQTPIDVLDLESVGRIEVIRGTAAALYGNASGGVIDLRSAPPPVEPLAADLRLWVGSDSTRRAVAVVGGSTGRFWYHGNVGRTVSSNFRDYADQRLTNGFARVGTTARGFDLSLQLMGLDAPLGQNPGALVRAVADTNPRAADPPSRTRLARKEVSQLQGGLSVSRKLESWGDVSGQLYTGTRSLYNPLTFAVVDLQRSLRGASVRWSDEVGIPGVAPVGAGRALALTAGYDYQWMGDDRLNWAACNGVANPNASCPEVGVEKGVLRIDQREVVHSSGEYVRAELAISRFRLSGGGRADQVTYSVTDRITTDGRDDSGTRTLRALSPMVGVAARVQPTHTVYVNYSTAFETPTTVELGNQPDGGAGFNPDLQPQRSNTMEGGAKGVARGRLHYDVALFSTRVRDELIPFRLPDGRDFFRNAGRTTREGLELGVRLPIERLELAGTATRSRFRFVDFVVKDTSRAGNVIPGIPELQGQLSATWKSASSFMVAEWSAKGEVWANDANAVVNLAGPNEPERRLAAAAPGYAIVNFRIGTTASYFRSRVTTVIGVYNLFDRKYISSVAINADGTPVTGKFYEPGSGISVFAGMHIRP